MGFRSVRSKIILVFIPLIVIPLLISGVIGGYYFQDSLKYNIQQDSLSQAISISAYTDNYISSSANYLESLATRPVLVQEMDSINASNDTSIIDTTVSYGANHSQFYSIYVTDPSGRVISSYPNASKAGQYIGNEPYVQKVLSTSTYQVMGPFANDTGESTVFISVPIANDSKLLGVMVGELDPDTIAGHILNPQAKNRQYIYIVNNTGNIVVHTNKSYIDSMANFSSVPAVQSVMQGMRA
jgi:methyl-accepting chemotaxis protein